MHWLNSPWIVLTFINVVLNPFQITPVQGTPAFIIRHSSNLGKKIASCNNSQVKRKVWYERKTLVNHEKPSIKIRTRYKCKHFKVFKIIFA